MRILVVDPAPGRTALGELEALAAVGLVPTVNLRRVADAGLRAELTARWDCVDVGGFSAAELAGLVEDRSGFDVVKCRAGIRVDRDLLRRATAPALDRPLRVLARAASGTDTFDLAAAREHGVRVLATPGANAAAVAEHTLALMLDALRGVGRRSADLHAGDWAAAVAGAPTRSLGDCTVGVVGTGAVGRAVANLVAAFGATVTGLGSGRPDPDRAAEWPYARAASLSELLEASDVVTLHVPLTETTRGMIGAPELGLLRPDAILVNTARGGVVDEAALDAALRSGDQGPALAAVDVFEAEGAGFRSPLAGNPRAILTPHVAGMTWSAMRASSRRLVEEIAAALADRSSASCDRPAG